MKKTCTIGLCLALASPVDAVPNDIFAIATIGDSLSDTGNLSGAFNPGYPPAALYYSDAASMSGTGIVPEDAFRRFSNGPVWIERFEDLIGGTPEYNAWFRQQYQQSFGNTVDGAWSLPDGSVGTVDSSDPYYAWSGANAAVGGAQTAGTLFGGRSLTEQGQFHADFLINGIPAISWPTFTTDQRDRTLYVVQGGGNDFFDITGPSDIPVVLQGAVDALGSIITDLADAGASHFLVPNLPGYIVADDWVTATPADVRGLSQAFNGLLAGELADLRTNLSVEIVEVDWFALFDRVAADPAAYGLANVTDPCLDLSAGLGFEGLCADPTQNMMYDALHPNSVMHQLMADAAYDAISAATVPLPAPIGLLTVGVAVMLQRRRVACLRHAGD